MYADIVVDTYTDPWTNRFTYSVPPELFLEIKVGQEVTVPFGKRTTRGWVVALHKASSVEHIKDILKINWAIPVLLPHQIKLALWMADYYHAPLVDSLGFMTPDLPKRGELPQKLNISPQPLDLIVIPSLNFLAGILGERHIQKKDVITWEAVAPKLKLFQTFCDVYEGKGKVVVGTRSVLFAPFQSLNSITIVDEQSESYFESRSPYFHTVLIGQMVAKALQCPLKARSASPRIDTVFESRKKRLSLQIDRPKSRPRTYLVDMALERKMGNKNILSENAVKLLNYAKDKNQTILFFLNKIKSSGNYFCDNCKTTDFAASEPSTCPVCHSPTLKFYSTHIDKLVGEISQIAKTNIEVITADKHRNNGAKITVATSAILFNPRTFDHVVAVAADQVLNMADYTSPHKTFSELINLSGRSIHTFLIQTYNPDNPVILDAANYKLKDFLKNEIISRKELELPPFVTLAKLSISGPSEEKIENNAESLVAMLEEKSAKNVQIIGPNPRPFASTPTYYIIIKAKSRKDLEPVLGLVPKKDWKVEINPSDTL